MCNSILKVTNGTESVNLLELNLMDWTPLLAPWKAGGIWSSSPFTDGSRLVNRNFDLTQDAFTLSPSGLNQDIVIEKVRLLIKLLEQAVSYWTTQWQNQPVWIEARGSQETNIRYANIHAYSIPELDNPYMPPFAAEALVTMENFTLILAHLLWMSQPPGSSECVITNNKSNWFTHLTPTDPTILESSDSAVYRLESDASVVYSTPAYIGYYVASGASRSMCTALRFRNVNVGRGTYVPTANADLEVCSAATYTPASSTLLRIEALKGKAFPLNPGFTCQDYKNMPRLGTTLTATIAGGWTNNTYYDLHSAMGDLLTEVFAQDTWERGDDLILFIECDVTATMSQRSFQLTTNLPRINFDAVLDMGSFQAGQCDGCDSIPVANKSNTAQINFVRKFDGGAAYESDYLPWIECDDDWSSVKINVFHNSNSIAVNAYMAFGIYSTYGGITIPNSGPFNSLVFKVSFDLGGGGAWTGKWQYWNGAWTDLPKISDTSNGFQNAGLHTVVFTPPVDWTTTTLSETGWFIRYLVTAVTVANSVGPKLVEFDPYTITTPYITIEDENGKGDVAALARTTAKALNPFVFVTVPGHFYGDLYIATRKISRGEEFTTFINFADEQNPSGITCAVTAPCTFMDTPAVMTYCTPTDRTIQWSPTAATVMGKRCTLTFDDTIAKQFYGTFAAFIRYYVDGGGDSDFTGKLVYSFGHAIWNQTHETEEVIFSRSLATMSVCQYMGNIVLGMPINQNEIANTHTIEVHLANSAVAAWGDIYLVDLVLVPLDEFTIHIESIEYVAGGGAGYWDAVAADSIGYPKTNLRVYNYLDRTGVIQNTLNFYANKGWMQQPGAQRIWFFTPSGSDLPLLVKQSASFRYLGMRGKS